MANGTINTSLPLSATGYWKPIQSGTGFPEHPVSSAGSSKSADAVSVSKLGQALSGVAADVFKQLDSKARGMLEGLVNTGKISAEDAVTGLKSLATKATFNRYVSERPRDEEDKQRLTDSEAAWQKLQAYGSRMSGALSEVGRKTQEIQEAQQRGEISMDEMNERLKPVQDAFKGEIAAARGAYGRPTDQTAILSDASGFTKNMQGFKSALASMGDDAGLADLYAPDGETAEQKLQELGFDRNIFGNAFQKFAETVDIPGIGPKSDAPSSPPGPENQAVTDKPSDIGLTLKLADALKGNALTMFNEALGDEDRRKLDDAVRAGALTGEDVAKGLTTRLKRIGFAQSGVDVATVDLDSEAANRALSGALLLQRGQRRPDTPAQPDHSPIRVDKPSPSPSPETSRDARASAYFLAIDDGGDDASKKIADLGISLSPFAAFGDAVRRLIGKGAFDYR
ncbi:hypothetical protein [Azospirillum brasilense]|uniref:hypothetical protein n=1 Tax=Azospirillum brasilense TaxID=192 RepID=UPI0020002AC5|nr:hypothetical protein [Azospirillum brasilense]